MSGRNISALMAVVALTAGCRGAAPSPMTDAERTELSAEIRAAADSIVIPFNRLDGSQYLAQLTDVRTYVENTTIYQGPDSVMSAVHTVLSNAATISLTWTGEPTVLVLGSDLGVVTGAFHESMTDKTGATQVLDGVWTAIYQRVDGSWKIVVAHESVAPVTATSETD